MLLNGRAIAFLFTRAVTAKSERYQIALSLGSGSRLSHQFHPRPTSSEPCDAPWRAFRKKRIRGVRKVTGLGSDG